MCRHIHYASDSARVRACLCEIGSFDSVILMVHKCHNKTTLLKQINKNDDTTPSPLTD